MKRFAAVVAPLAAIGFAVPAAAQNIQVRVGDGVRHHNHGAVVVKKKRPKKVVIIKHDRGHHYGWHRGRHEGWSYHDRVPGARIVIGR